MNFIQANQNTKQFLADFFKKHWENNYCFLKNAVDIGGLSFGTNELVEMAQDEYFETRLVTQETSNNWDVHDGPHPDFNFENKKKLWTLIVHNLNLYDQFCFDLEKGISDIPKWLFDDVMCTYSTDGSTVGAHTDNYNVFIIQISGERLWEIQENPITEYREDCNIKVLKEFRPDHVHTLSAGDLIFIPPGVAHRGTSIGNSISLSIGFKALEDKPILEAFLYNLIADKQEGGFFKTDEKMFNESQHTVSNEMIDTLYERALASIKDKELFKTVLLEGFSASKVACPIENDPLSEEDFSNAIKINGYQLFEDLNMSCPEDGSCFYINQLKFKSGNDIKNKFIADLNNRGQIRTTQNENYISFLFILFEHNLLALED